MGKNFFFIFKKTIKSLSAREEMISVALVIIMLISGFFIYEKFNNSTITSVEGNNEIIKNKIYIEGLVGQIKRINPLYIDLNPIDRDVSRLIFSGLSKYDPETKNFIEDLAFHTLSADKKTYTFTIKPNISWHDGTPVSANDIYFTYATVIQDVEFQNPILKANFQGVTIEKLNENSVNFTLKTPNSFFFSNLTVGLLPYHIFKNITVKEIEKHEFNKNPIGTGVYKVSESLKNINDTSQQIILEKYNNYYGTAPKIEKVKFITFSDKNSLIEAKTSVHGIGKIIEEDYLQNLRNDPRFKVYKYTLPQYTAVFYNVDSKILNPEKVRLGLTKAIDKEELIKKLINKRRIDTPLLELNQDEWINKSNIEEAKGALFDSGWYLSSEVSQTRENKKGEKLELTIMAQNYPYNPNLQAETQTVLEFLKNSWGKIGIQINIQTYNVEELQDVIKDRTYDMLLSGESLGYNLDTYSYWHSSQANENGLNLSNYRNAKADSLIESIREIFPENEETIKTKNKKLNQLAETIHTDIPAIFLYTPIYYFAADSQITNIELTNLAFPSDRFAHFENWQFTKKEN